MSEVYDTDRVLTPADSAVGQIRPFEIVHPARDSRNYLPSLGLFGTAGNPEEVYDWRADTTPQIHEALALRGLEKKVSIYNPLKKEWRPEDAPEEARHLARDAAIVLPILDLTSGHASLGESGFAALGSTLRPQSVTLCLEPGHEQGDLVQRARALTTLLANETLKDFPINATMAPDLQSMIDNGIRNIGDFADNIGSRVLHENRYTIPRRTDLEPKVALIGSGASQYSDSWYEGMGTFLENADVSQAEQYNAYVKNWSFDDALTELEHKTNDAVVLFAVTENENSYGAMGELGWLVTYCLMNSQKLGIYVEGHDSSPKSDQNRQRKLAMAHLGRHLLDFPDLSDGIFIAKSPAELARFGASELAKYKQLQKASKSAALSIDRQMR